VKIWDVAALLFRSLLKGNEAATQQNRLRKIQRPPSLINSKTTGGQLRHPESLFSFTHQCLAFKVRECCVFYSFPVCHGDALLREISGSFVDRCCHFAYDEIQLSDVHPRFFVFLRRSTKDACPPSFLGNFRSGLPN
jgi:hypothetical protein